MKIQKQVILLMVIIVVEFHCEEIVIGNEGLELPKENQDLQEIIENAHNSPLLSEVNDSELPENPFAVKEKRCPKYRLGSSLVGPSLNSNNIDNKNHKLYGAFCKTCLIRNKCDSISDCHLCEKWCTSTSKLCSETDADGDTKGKLSEDEQPKDETVSLANRGSFNNDEEKSKDNINTITLNRGDLLEIVLSLLGMLDTKDVESMTISIKTKEGKPIVLNNEENSLKDVKLGEKLKDLCAFSKKFPVDEEKNPDHEKLHELVQELLTKLRSYSHDDGSLSASADDDSPAVGSSNNIPGVASRLKDAESIEKVLHQSLMNPDIIEDTPDMSQMRDQRIRTLSGLLESPEEKQQINGEFLTPSENFATRKNYEPLNSKDFINTKDQNVGTSFSRNKIFDHNDFEEEAAEEIQKPSIGAASAAKPLLAKITNFDLKPQDVDDRLQTQHSQNSGLNKIFDHTDVEEGAEEIQKPLMGAASAARPLLTNIRNTNFDLKPQEVMDRLRTQHSHNSGINKIFDHNDVKEGAEEIQKPLMGAASAAGPLLAKMGNANFDLKPQEVMNRLQSQLSQNSELFNKQNAEGHNVGKVSDAFTLNEIIDHNNIGDRHTNEVQTVAKEAATAAKQFSQFNENNEENLGEPIHSLHHPLHHISHHIPHHHNPLHHIPHHHIPHKSKFLHHHRSSEPNDLFASDGSQLFDSNVRQQNRDNELNSRFNPQQYDRFVGEPLYSRDVPLNSRFASQQYDSPVGQPFNEFNNRLVPQQYNNFDQLNSRFPSEQIDNPLGQPINRNNQFNSGFAQQQYNIPVGQTFNNRESEFNPFQQFDDLQGQPINRNSQLNSRFVPQMYDRNANVPSEVSRVDSSHKVKISSKEPSSGDNSLFFHDKENTSDKIGTPTSHSQVLVGTKNPQHNEDLSSDIKHLNNHQRVDEDKKDDEVSMPNTDSGKHNLGISSDIFNSIENDSQSKQNDFGARASELLKKLKDKQDQRLENKKQQLEKARKNILGMVKTADGLKMSDEDKKLNPSNTSEDSKLQSTPENIPNIIQNIAAATKTLSIPQSALDKVKELSNSEKQPNINDLTHLFSRNNEDIVGSQPLENSFERMAPDNVPNSRSSFNPRPASSRQTLPEEHPLEALNLDGSDSVVGMPTPDVDSRGKFDDTQPNSNSLGKIIPAEKGADISFKNSSDIFFIGNGIKLPLRMATNSDGSVHFTVDIDKLCSCNNTSCPKNHTAKELEQTVEAILEKEAELKNEIEDFGDVPLGMAAPNIGFDDDHKEKERSQRETVKNSNFINLKNRIANKFLSSIEDERNDFKIKRSIDENTAESDEQVFETENLSPSITRVIRKGFKDIKKAISNIPKNTQLITTRLLMPDEKSNIMQPTHNIFDSKTLEDNNENVIPISKMYKFKGLEDQLAKKMENIEKTVENYSKIDDQIFENESAVLNKFNEDPIINKEVGLASDVLGFFKKLAVDSTKHKNL